jgi:hypothetical protein
MRYLRNDKFAGSLSFRRNLSWNDLQSIFLIYFTFLNSKMSINSISTSFGLTRLNLIKSFLKFLIRCFSLFLPFINSKVSKSTLKPSYLILFPFSYLVTSFSWNLSLIFGCLLLVLSHTPIKLSLPKSFWFWQEKKFKINNNNK